MSATFRVSIEPKVLSFAINHSGYSKEELLNKVHNRFGAKYFTDEYLDSILKGESDPKYTDLKKIDTYVKRGIPFYFLEEPPEEELFIDFRKSHSNYKITPKMEVLLRDFHYLREEIKIILDDEGIDFKRKLPIHNSKDDPVLVAAEIREKYDIGFLDISKISSREVFEYLRKRIEENNIFVFKDSLEPSLRGCIFLENNLPPLILINSNDDKNAEIFSLLHELGHYLLNEEDLDVAVEKSSIKDEKSIESWCNEFAYHFLMKEEDEKEENFTKGNKEVLMDSDKLKKLSKKYKISKHAFVYRFLRLGIIKIDEYYSFVKKYPFKKKRSNKESGGNYHNTNRDRLSRKFISLVFNSYNDGNLSLRDTYRYLKVKDTTHIEHLLEVV